MLRAAVVNCGTSINQTQSCGSSLACHCFSARRKLPKSSRRQEDTDPRPPGGAGPPPTMSPMAQADRWDRHVSKLIFILFVAGAVLMCVGVLMSVFGFQACYYEAHTKCSLLLKVAGPSCVVMGLGAVILARSRARLQLLEGRRRGSQQDPDAAFLCGESRQFAQCLIFGVLFLTSGLLISVLGIWVPGCDASWTQEPLNETDTAASEPQICGFLTLQILGPLIVLVGLCFFVAAHIKKRNSTDGSQDAAASEEGQAPSTEPVHVTVGDSVIIFPPPPPPYFPESSASGATRSPQANRLHQHESPPSYYSIFNFRTPAPEGLVAASARERESVYTISGTCSALEGSTAPHLPPDSPPPVYEEKGVTAVTSPPPP
ncbi:transmembrane protein 171 isoform X2 [Echinops telfairi]|uniref:Transmembrane protein 171 isoform X2 n=1 Tax=Echinops telfairi TaxID=9371 RepID=A0ABM0ZQM8_ECHTE|nr:transmembrane protein 171 isoform X2 [Echinops telfairi]